MNQRTQLKSNYQYEYVNADPNIAPIKWSVDTVNL